MSSPIIPRSFLNRALITGLALSIGVGCPEPVDSTGFRAQVPEIAVPDALDVGEQPVNLTYSATVTVNNAGTAPMEVTARLEGDSVWSVNGEASFEVPRKEAYDLTLDFLPTERLRYSGTLVLESDDPDDPEVRIALDGQGVPAPVPILTLSQGSLQFGTKAEPVEGLQTGQVLIENTGLEDLVLGTVQRTGSGRFDLLLDPSNTTIAPGDTWPLVVTYEPSTDPKVGVLGDNGEIRIPSNDPELPEAIVLMLGNGGADYDYPIADFDCPTTSFDPPGFLTFDAVGSSDPEGFDPLSYAWTIADQPAGSQAYLTSASGDQTSLWLDAAGDYALELTVTNSIDTTSAPLRCDIEALPAEDVHVELSWDTARADLDLHLAIGDAELFEVPGDCNFCNEVPSWGESGVADDPRLDLDDRAGFGPENIVVQSPADGVYTARVHYYDDNNDGDVTATVRIWLDGSLALTASKLMSLGEVWDAAEIAWPTATAAALATPLYETTTSTCFTP